MIRSRLRPYLAQFFRRRLIHRGTDATSGIARGSALVLAPHADDEAIGCGVMIARKAAAGTPVTIVIATDGRHAMRSREIGAEELARLRRVEAVEAAHALGLEPDAVRFLDFEDGSLAGQPAALADRLLAILDELQPDEVYAPHADEHPDHRTLSEVARTVVLRARARPPLYEYPVRYWTRVPWILPASNRLQSLTRLLTDPVREYRRPPALLVRGEEFREQQLAALRVYAGEMRFVGDLVYPYVEAEYEVFFPVPGSRPGSGPR